MRKILIVAQKNGQLVVAKTSGNLPYVTSIENIDSFVKKGGEQILLNEFGINPNSKGVPDELFGEIVDVLFVAGDFEITGQSEFKRFNFSDGYVLLPYLSWMHKGLFEQA